jgi:cation diffusion facilitator family transporter
VSTEGGTKAVLAAFAANTGIAVSKLVAWAATGSSAMLSEAIHSFADAGNQVLLLVGGRRSRRAADDLHQFGYGRTRYVYGFLVAIVLFLLGGLFSLYEGWHKWHFPEELTSPAWAFGVLGVAIVLEALSLRTAVREANKVRGTRSLWQFVRECRQPELPIVVAEDIGALVGLVFALAGVTAATVTGDGRWDGVGAMAIGTLLVVIAVFLAAEMASMLVGESVLPEQQRAVAEALQQTPGVQRVIHLRTTQLGADEVLVAAKIAVGATDSAVAVARIIDDAEVAVRRVLPSASFVFLEPDIDRSPVA